MVRAPHPPRTALAPGSGPMLLSDKIFAGNQITRARAAWFPQPQPCKSAMAAFTKIR